MHAHQKSRSLEIPTKLQTDIFGNQSCKHIRESCVQSLALARYPEKKWFNTKLMIHLKVITSIIFDFKKVQ